ncbi:MAG: M15 family metallopeptidase, partial [Lachnospiraceae bacterium]|nr:M15 family metallopeptidase [Lachnospiraceae bacterium]
MKMKSMKTILCFLLSACMFLTLSACAGKKEERPETSAESEKQTETEQNAGTDQKTETRQSEVTEQGASGGIDYLALVNKLNPLPDGWEDALETVTVSNSLGDEVEVEAKAYEAYERMRDDLEKNDGIYIELDSARRSIAAQQDIMDRFIEKYGADYASKTVAQPGYSEHHTGLALDLYLIIDGKDVVENEDMIQYPEIWEKIHAKLADYGFILRYPKGSGYMYEP